MVGCRVRASPDTARTRASALHALGPRPHEGTPPRAPTRRPTKRLRVTPRRRTMCVQRTSERTPTDGTPTARPHRREGEQPLPRLHDVRRQDEPGRLVRHHRQGDRPGHQLHRHGQCLQHRPKRRGDGRGAAPQRPPQPRRPGHEGPRRDGQRRPEHAGQLAPPHHSAVRGVAAPAQDRLDRPLSDPPAAVRHPDRRDAAGARRP